MAKFTHNGKTYSTKDRPKGMSEREFIASVTGKSTSSSSNNEKKSSSPKEKNVAPRNDLSSMISDITRQTVGAVQKDPVADFNASYNPANDITQAKATFEPFYNSKIDSLLEDLKSTENNAAISYDRTLRRARFTAAAQGGAIGSERVANEKEITDQQKFEKDNRLKSAERAVGTSKMQEQGYQPVTGNPQEGSIFQDMKANIAEEQLRLKDMSQARYVNDAANYYNS